MLLLRRFVPPRLPLRGRPLRGASSWPTPSIGPADEALCIETSVPALLLRLTPRSIGKEGMAPTLPACPVRVGLPWLQYPLPDTSPLLHGSLADNGVESGVASFWRLGGEADLGRRGAKCGVWRTGWLPRLDPRLMAPLCIGLAWESRRGVESGVGSVAMVLRSPSDTPLPLPRKPALPPGIRILEAWLW